MGKTLSLTSSLLIIQILPIKHFFFLDVDIFQVDIHQTSPKFILLIISKNVIQAFRVNARGV